MPAETGTDPGTAQQLVLEAADVVDRGLTCIKASIAIAHPTAGCLPLPDLAAPLGAQALYTYASEIEASLWADSVNWTPPWRAALTECTHGLGTYGVSATFVLLQAWRALISRAADHASGQAPTDAYSLGGRIILLSQAAQNLAALSGRRP